jgi:hypothetical protein
MEITNEEIDKIAVEKLFRIHKRLKNFQPHSQLLREIPEQLNGM